MITINFYCCKNKISGFDATGHADTAPYGEDIVCAAVSSACLMAANTITEIIGLKADATSESGDLHFAIKGNNVSAQDTLAGLKLHLEELQKQYPENIKVIYSEV